MTATELERATWQQTEGAALVLVPVGSLEQHGPHLPLDTDTTISAAVARGVADRIPGAWVAPPLVYTASGEHQSFSGTCSIGSDVLALVVIELVRSMRTWARRVVLVNAHGGNLTALERAVSQLRQEGHDVSWLPCATGQLAHHHPPDLHAGHFETSLMLHIAPWSVRLHLAEAGDRRALRELLPALISGGVASVSANGVLGDPSGSSAAAGERLLASIVDAVHCAVTT